MLTGPKTGKIDNDDDAVAEFVRNTWSKILPVTMTILLCKTKEAITKLRIKNFKTSRGWYKNLWGMSICHKRPMDFKYKFM